MTRQIALLRLEFMEAQIGQLVRQSDQAWLQQRSIDAAALLSRAKELRSEQEELEEAYV